MYLGTNVLYYIELHYKLFWLIGCTDYWLQIDQYNRNQKAAVTACGIYIDNN